jgi:hypothetical protein
VVVVVAAAAVVVEVEWWCPRRWSRRCLDVVLRRLSQLTWSWRWLIVSGVSDCDGGVADRHGRQAVVADIAVVGRR